MAAKALTAFGNFPERFLGAPSRSSGTEMSDGTFRVRSSNPRVTGMECRPQSRCEKGVEAQTDLGSPLLS